MINESDFSLSLLMNPLISIPTDGRLKYNNEYERTDLPNEGASYKIPMGNKSFFPKDWIKKRVMIEIDKKFMDMKHEKNIIRLFSSSGPRDYFFSIDAKMSQH
jgi:hypothetical protein